MPAPTGYSRTQIVLHWVVLVLIALQYLFHDAISSAWDRVEEGAEVAFDPLVLGHVAGGGLVLLLALWRLGLRARRGAPAPLDSGRLQVVIAKLTHTGLYALMILMPVSGAVAWFGGVGAAAEGHEVLKALLLALVALHVVGAVYHQLVLRDGTMARMRRSEG